MSPRSLNILNNFNPKIDKNLINYLDKNSIKYLIKNDSYILPNCLKINHIKTIKRKAATRNFLIKKHINSPGDVKVFEIVLNNCKY